MKVILGPAVCKVCRRAVYWATGKGRAAHDPKWRNADGKLHRCKP